MSSSRIKNVFLNKEKKLVTFITGGAQRAFPSYDGSWKRLFSDYKVPKQTTTYACQSFDFPTTVT